MISYMLRALFPGHTTVRVEVKTVFEPGIVRCEFCGDEIRDELIPVLGKYPICTTCQISGIRVSAHSFPGAVAMLIVGTIREQGKTQIQVVGDAVDIATSQAIKAIVLARETLAPEGIDIACTPFFPDSGTVCFEVFINNNLTMPSLGEK